LFIFYFAAVVCLMHPMILLPLRQPIDIKGLTGSHSAITIRDEKGCVPRDHQLDPLCGREAALFRGGKPAGEILSPPFW
jgi:hypothetical protein